ncbi:MAG: choice-of-anchor D domain-containing protein [Salinivirgaceae bacterium]|nr:choice-of-anchor D domain-containing protein [Salinivirgaceae bacterium]
MRRRFLLVLSALILTVGGLSAQSHGKHALKRENPRAKAAQEWVEKMKADNGKSATSLFKTESAAKDGPQDFMVSVVPKEPVIEFNLSDCDQTQARPMVVKNTTDEPLDVVILSSATTFNLGRKVLDDMIWGMSIIDGYVYGYSDNYGETVQIDLATGEVVKTIKGFDYVASAGGKMWASGIWNDNKGFTVAALDENMNLTDFSFETSVRYPFIAADGDNLLVYGCVGNKFCALSYNTSGELVADYGTIDMPSTELVAYNPATRTFWFGACVMGMSMGVQINNGKLEVSDIAPSETESGMTCYAVFDENGKPYYYSVDYSLGYYNPGVYEGESLLFGKAITFSQNKLSLQPGQQTTVNITANTAAGSAEVYIGAINPKLFLDEGPESMLFSREIAINVDITPKYEIYGDSVLTAYTGYESTGIIWIKNTGCQNMPIFEAPHFKTSGTGFRILPRDDALIVPSDFYNDYTLYPGDSLGVMIGFYTENTGSFTNKFGFPIGKPSDYFVAEVDLKATATDLAEQLSIASTEIDTTLTECVTTLTVPNKIENNTSVPVTVVGGFDFTFNVITKWDPGYQVWTLYDANDNVVYSAPSGTYTQSNTTYTGTLNLPVGSYRLYLQNWWYNGFMSIGNSETTLVSNTTSRGGKTIEFDVTPDDCLFKTTIAPDSSIDALQIPVSVLNMHGDNTLLVYAEGIDGAVNEIELAVDGGKAELAVVESFDFGNQIKNNDARKTLTLFNSGCATLNIEQIRFKNLGYFALLYGGNVYPAIGEIEIEPNASKEITLGVYPDSVGPFADTLIIKLSATDSVEVAISATGVGAPETVFDDYVVKDTINYGTQSVTLSSMVHNDGNGDLVIAEPLSFSYNAGSGKHGVYIDTYHAKSGSWWGPDEWLTSNFDFDYYDMAPGEYELRLYLGDEDVSDSDAYISISSGNDTIVNKIMVKDICTWDNYDDGDYAYKFTITEDSYKKYTVAPGDSLPLTMNIATADLPVGSHYFYKYFSTNDSEWDNEMEMDAQILVKGDTAVSVPETLAFGNVQLGSVGKQTFTLTNTGGAEFELDYRISGTGFSFVNASADVFDWKLTPKQVVELEVNYTPTAVGAATGELKILEYNNEKVLATIALSAAGVAAVEPEYDTLRITAECGQTEVKATHTITNNSEAQLQYVPKPRLRVYSGAQNHPQTIWLEIYTIDKWNNFGTRIFSIPTNTYTVSGKMYEQILDLPAGNYGVRFRDSQSNGYSNGGYVSVVIDDKSILRDYEYNILDAGYNYSSYTNYLFTIPETEPIVVPANGSTIVENTYSLEGLTGGEYIFTRILDRSNIVDDELICDTLVTVVTIESKLDYAYSKDSVEFLPVHVGESGYASLYLENTGCEVVEIDGWDMLDGTNFKASFMSRMGGLILSPEDLILKSGKKVPFYISFNADEAGTYRDTLVIVTTRGIDRIPVVATANTTQVMAVSTPTVSGSYRTGNNIVINISFDDAVELDNTAATAKPKLLMNTGGNAVLEDERIDDYTLSFVYPVAATDNIAKLAITGVEWNGVKVLDATTGSQVSVATLPANNEFAATNIALDNILPTVAISTSATETTAAIATLTVAFSEEITGFAQSDIALSEGAEISSFTTTDNATFVAELSLPHAVVTNISVAANVADLAGNPLAVAWTGSIASVHDYDTTIFEPTFDSIGYTMLICKICGDTTYVDTVPMIKVVSIALSNMPKKLNYTEGELIDLTGAKLTVTFNNGTTKVVDLTSAMISGFDAKKTGKQTITVTYVDGGETFTVTFDVTIDAKDTAIDENAAEINIFAINRTIVVETADAFAGEIAVFDVNGRMVAKELAEGTRTELSMKNTGVYIVRVGNTTQRVVLY